MRTAYLLDTSVLIDDPHCFKKFINCDVIIPIAVLNELDKLKKQSNEAGKNARVCIKLIDEVSDLGDISLGILLDNNSLVKIDATYYDTNKPEYAGFGDPTYGDTQILACLYINWLSHQENNVILVSNDINLRIKAKARGIEAMPYESNASSTNELYSGIKVVDNADAANELLEIGAFDPRVYNIDLNYNEFIYLKNNEGETIVGRKTSSDKVKKIKHFNCWGISAKNKEQECAIDLIMDRSLDLVTLIGRSGTGKSLIALAAGMEAVLNKNLYDKLIIYRPVHSVGKEIGHLPGPQPMDAKIATPDGWITMGELKIGDYVIGRDGKPAKILNIYPKGYKSVYKITTTDDTSTECCEDHLWYTYTSENIKRKKEGSIKTTKEISDSLLNNNNKINHFLPRNEAVEFKKNKLPISPYMLGVILGDGCIKNNISFTSMDEEIVDRVREEAELIGCRIFNNKNTISYNISSKLFNNKPAKLIKTSNIITGEENIYASIGLAAKANQNIKIGSFDAVCKNKQIINNIKYEFLPSPVRWQNPLKELLFKLGLENKKSWEKFIPNEYKYSSIEDRISLLRGLMDTDGTVKESGEASFTTTSESLAQDVIEIVRSLGGRASLKYRNRVGKKSLLNDREIIKKRISYEFSISLPETINPFYLSRKAVKYKKKYIHKVGIKSIEYVGQKEVQCILIDNPEHLYLTDNFIVTHNTVEEKLAPWFQAIMDNMEVLLSNKTNRVNGDWKKDLEMLKKKGKIEMEAITFIRGRSIPRSLIIMDECQNISKEEIKTLLTRAGEGSKIILTGDVEQIDNVDLDLDSTSLTYVIDKFKDSHIAGHVTLTKGERSRLATISASIL